MKVLTVHGNQVGHYNRGNNFNPTSQWVSILGELSQELQIVTRFEDLARGAKIRYILIEPCRCGS